jgi:Rrf2 family cysteine metabolism transcriptional repressor
MIKLSTKGRYGLRAMVEIAVRQDEGPVTSHTISQSQDISERYLEQLLIPLKQAGLVKSLRGSQGGYILGRKPEDIIVGEIISVLEGPIAPTECVNDSYPETCKRSDFCVTRKIWSEVKEAINKVLNSYTLEDLVRETRNIEIKGTRLYDI